MFAAIKIIRYAYQNKLFFIPIRPKVFSLGFERKQQVELSVIYVNICHYYLY